MRLIVASTRKCQTGIRTGLSHRAALCDAPVRPAAPQHGGFKLLTAPVSTAGLTSLLPNGMLFPASTCLAELAATVLREAWSACPLVAPRKWLLSRLVGLQLEPLEPFARFRIGEVPAGKSAESPLPLQSGLGAGVYRSSRSC